MSITRRFASGGTAALCLLCLSVQGSTDERVLRIRELGKRNASVIPALAQDLHDPNLDVRLEVVKSIVHIDTAASLTPLVEATKDKEPEIQIRATDGIVNAYAPGYVARSGLSGSFSRGFRHMKSYFATRNDQIISPTAQVAADVNEALGNLIRNASDTDAQANAALAAGILRDRPAVPALSQALHSKNDSVIFESLVALQKIGDSSAGPSVSFLVTDLDERIQLTALETIGVLHSTDSASQVRTAVSRTRNDKVRRAALQTLALIAQPIDQATFRNFAESKDPVVRSAALEGLGRLREPDDFPVLQKAFDEGDIDSRIHLAAAFGMVNQGKVTSGEFDPLPFLVENLRVRGRDYIAIAYLGELARKEDVRVALTGLMSRMDKAQKVAFCSALEKAKSPDVTPMLDTLARDPDPDVVTAASRAKQLQKNLS